MRIGLITDTHIPDVARELPPEVFDIFNGVDLILHAGDIYNISVLNDLQKIAPVKAALGDDDSTILLRDERVETKHVLNLEGYSTWLMHERPYIYRNSPDKNDGLPDIIIHGHSHAADIRHYNSTLIIGSGSPTFLHYRREPGTVAVLEIGPDGPDASIVKLGNCH